MNLTSFTFLATILILVLFSLSLVLRSYVLRRRYRLRFQHALTDGLFADFDRGVVDDPLVPFRRPPRRLGPSPVLWDIWIHPTENFMPVAVRCDPTSSLSSPPASLAPSSFIQVPPRPLFLSQLRLPSPLAFSRRTSPPSTPARCPTTQSPPPVVPTPPDASDTSATLQVCVLVAMPTPSSPAHRSLPNAKGKGVDPLEFQAHHPGGDADPLLPPSRCRPGQDLGVPIPISTRGLPPLEFGVLEVKTGNWVWNT